MFPTFLLPAELPLTDCTISLVRESLVIEASSCQSGSICPACGYASIRRHSKYIRTLVDLPTSGYDVKVLILSGKYFCDNAECSRKIFTERFKQEISPYYRRFNRCKELLRNFALELGGNKGAAISRLAKLPVSPSTILRIIKRQHLPIPMVTSGIIGIDDWAFKKGNTYGTIIVDLTQNKVIDLLADRESETICKWLKEHQELKIISRDRGGPYSKGALEGAPQAIQVADRFHLLMNLGDATKKMFQSMGKELKELFTLYHNADKPVEPVSTPEDIRLSEVETENKATETINTNIELQLRFNKVKELFSQGYTIRAISRSLHVTRITIRKYIGMDFLPKKNSSRSTNFDFFHLFLLHESNKGKLYTELYAAILSEGFNGGYTQFCSNMNELLGNHKIIPASRKIDPVAMKTWSPRKLSIMIQMDAKDLNTEDRKFMELFYDKHPVIKETEQFISRFKNLFKIKEEGTLTTWLEDVAKSTSAIKRFAKGIQSDFQAVNNAVVTPYSNGQVEGQVNRLKNIKRRMYGRAGFELLRKMVIFQSG